VNVTETITRFTEFYRDRGHQLIPGSTLIPAPGDAVLFTTSGMHPLTRYLEGRPHPSGSRLAGRQRCLRTTDLDEVGDDTHLTVFQMLGTWSLGDYDGPQSLRWCHELVTGGLGISPGRLHATAFGGDGELGPDTELARTWEELGVPVELAGPDQNWWSNGPTGLCGPDSELFVWTGTGPPRGTPSGDDQWLELWNHVMLRYSRQPDGSLRPLGQRSIDTGMGLERLLMITQGRRSVYDCDVFEPWRVALTPLWQPDEQAFRLLADHLRSSIAVIGDGVRPSSSGRGYVLRRLLRRALTALWREDGSRTLADLPDALTEHTLTVLHQRAEPGEIREVIAAEERRFAGLLTRGRRVLARYSERGLLTEADLSCLHQTHGLPPDLVALLTEDRPAAGLGCPRPAADRPGAGRPGGSRAGPRSLPRRAVRRRGEQPNGGWTAIG